MSRNERGVAFIFAAVGLMSGRFQFHHDPAWIAIVAAGVSFTVGALALWGPR